MYPTPPHVLHAGDHNRFHAYQRYFWREKNCPATNLFLETELFLHLEKASFFAHNLDYQQVIALFFLSNSSHVNSHLHSSNCLLL